MKLLFIFDSTYPYYTGGIETWMYNVCERLIERHEITIFTVKKFRKDDKMGKFENINPKIKIIPVKNLNHIPVIRHFVRSYVAFINGSVTIHSMRRAIRGYIRKDEDYCVISLGTVFAAKTARLIKNEFPNVVSIVSNRSLHPEVLGETYPGVKNIAMGMERKNLETADSIWTNGEDTYQILKRKGFESTVIKNGTDIARLEDTQPYDMKKMGLENKFIIVTIGTVQKIKGYYEIIESLKILKEKHHFEAHFVGVGKGNLDKFIKYAKKCGVEKQVHLVGEQRNVVAYAKAADVIAGAGGGGGYGMAVIESMVSETPIVAWNVLGYRQMIRDKKEALLVKPWNSEALAEGFYYVAKHKEEGKIWGKAAHERAKAFDWNNVLFEIERELEKYEKK